MMSRGPGKPPDDERDEPDEPDDVEGYGDEDDETADADDDDDDNDDDDDVDDADDDDDVHDVEDLGVSYNGNDDDDDDDDGGSDDNGDNGDGEPDDEEEDEEPSIDDLPASTVFVATATPLQLAVSPMPDDRAPDGVCLASRIDGRLVARCAMPGESIERLMTLKLFEEPVMIGLLAFEGEPGIQARLVALVPSSRLTEGSSEEDEPWKASVPSFEKAQREAAEGEEGEAEGAGLAAILLGHIVRFSSDRKHPDDLAREAVDILQRVVAGTPLDDAAAKAIDDLLDSL
jgi:hypothetical protein